MTETSTLEEGEQLFSAVSSEEQSLACKIYQYGDDATDADRNLKKPIGDANTGVGHENFLRNQFH
jgi:hypothetical protein